MSRFEGTEFKVNDMVEVVDSASLPIGSIHKVVDVRYHREGFAPRWEIRISSDLWGWRRAWRFKLVSGPW